MRSFFFVLLSVFPCFQGIAQINFSTHFEQKTLRLDYIQAGTANSSEIYFKELREEPYWGGSLNQLIDTFGYGMYKLEVKDSLNGKLIYSRGFNTLFQEWQTTIEASKISRAFKESVIMPYPKNTVLVEIYARDRKLKYSKLFERYINPKDYFIHRENPPSWPVQKIVNSGSPDKNVDLVFIPEGYTKAEMDKFKNDVTRFTSELFSWQPFTEFKNKFNIWLVEAPSDESGTDIPGDSIWKKTILNSNFYTFDIERYLTTEDYWAVRDVASCVPYDQICILVNTDKYGGGGIYNFYNLSVSDNEYSEYVFVHEFGHSFTCLADEYYASETAYNEYYDLQTEPYEVNITTLVNFDKKWKSLLEDDIPVPTPADSVYLGKTGVFEGGGYLAKGIYRPSMDCSMKSQSVNNFCAVCQKALEDMIRFLTE
ncbi:MAG: peptidase M64 [Bacteroidales bacterium]|nr:peptidase M64 [Bacteroidales bacterium]